MSHISGLHNKEEKYHLHPHSLTLSIQNLQVFNWLWRVWHVLQMIYNSVIHSIHKQCYFAWWGLLLQRVKLLWIICLNQHYLVRKRVWVQRDQVWFKDHTIQKPWQSTFSQNFHLKIQCSFCIMFCTVFQFNVLVVSAYLILFMLCYCCVCGKGKCVSNFIPRVGLVRETWEVFPSDVN
jgi:hypothetical protein